MNGIPEPWTPQKSALPARAGSGRKKSPPLTCERVRELFDYREEGYLVRRTSQALNADIGQRVGVVNSSGYVVTSVGGRLYYVHRLVWFWHHGYFPETDLDHIDRDRTNNKVENLRVVSRACNNINRGNSLHTTSGVKGVSRCKATSLYGKPWVAQIKIKGRPRFLGAFADLTEAVTHRLAAEQCLGWEGCDSCSPAYLYLKESILK